MADPHFKTSVGGNINKLVNVGHAQAVYIQSDEQVHDDLSPALWSDVDYRSEVDGLLRFYSTIFVGRNDEFDIVYRLSCEQDPGYLLLEAPAGYGKSAFFAELINRFENGSWDVEISPALLYFFI